MKKCPNCGKMIEDDANFCSNCSTDLSKKSSKSSVSTKLLIVVVIAVIAIVGVALASGMFSSDDSSVHQDTSSQNNHPNTANDDSNSNSDDSSSKGNVYWASAKSDKFHLPTCEWAEKISENNKIVYTSRDDAIADGKQPCDVCNP